MTFENFEKTLDQEPMFDGVIEQGDDIGQFNGTYEQFEALLFE